MVRSDLPITFFKEMIKTNEFEIRWSYQRENSEEQDYGQEIVTECQVRFPPVSVSPRNWVYDVLTGICVKSRTDPHNKDIARKLSLKRAIAELPANIRTQIWEVYNNRKQIIHHQKQHHAVTE